MSPEVVAAIIAASVSFLTLIGTLAAQYFGRRATSRDTQKALEEQSKQLDRTLAEQRTRTLNERFATAAEQLGSDKPAAVQLAGVYAMSGLADDWEENRQTCIDVLCAYLRLPYRPDPGGKDSTYEPLAFRASREVRHTVIRVITAHLRDGARVSWQGRDFDFTGVVFDGGDFSSAVFSGGRVSFDAAKFNGWASFDDAKFSGGEVSFGGAKFSGGLFPFSRAEFSGGEVTFAHVGFSGGLVSFDGAKFSGGLVDFAQAVFSGGRVSFSGAVFSGSQVYFHRAKFSGSQVYFIDATFSGGQVDFDATFSGGEVSFGAEFSGGLVDFDHAKFSGARVDFIGAKFSDQVSLDFSADFSAGLVDFAFATFSGGQVSFDGARFFGARVDFSYVSDWSVPPKLPGTTPSGVTLPQQQDQSKFGP